MKITSDVENQLHEIIKMKAIKAVFQPIVSLKDGSVFAYEALSRITLDKCVFCIGEAFDIAKEINCLWVLKNYAESNQLRKQLINQIMQNCF